ncbi:MAG: mandelate racemase/muconate lactonizing enzyme family protein [Planctomycetes bacterium]|nr:mandelate racemase/muconate lactonizing enzyme family protein [Planctomycetota bacterium]
MKITEIQTFAVDVPQKYPIAPYQSRYRAASSTKAVLFRIETDSGIVGWGEAPQRYLGEQLTSGEADKIRDKLIGRDPTAIEWLYADAGLDGGYVQSGVEMAMWDILGKVCNQPLYQLLGGLYRERVELACCMGIRPPNEAAEIAKLYVEMGFTTLKTKAGRDPEEDLGFVRAIRDAVGDQLKLRIDPNTGYSPDVCLQLAKDLEPYNLEYFEQPMPADLIEDSARIRKLTSTPLALNESVTTMEQVRKILEANAAAVLLPDTYQCGGLWAVKLIADIAASANVPVVMHCSHDLGPKTATMLHLVASTPNFSLANDCTYYGLEDDVITQLFKIEEGHLPVPKGPGLGIEVDLAKVRRFSESPD